jgi:hypothetical protein
MESQFKRLLSLAKKTGDSLIIMDEKNGESYVLLSLEKYESLLDPKPAFIEPAPSLVQAQPESIAEVAHTQGREEEAVEGEGTKVVSLSKTQESEPDEAEKYYFEELGQESESETESDPKEVEPLK